ncbi:MAG: Membrane protein involved in aromatic hydrocarbon degradation [Proteobacteria bacterium]|nr:Membrane protein involved in aromatic hydrocarbon degradation [Pseudomonadota bacterium]
MKKMTLRTLPALLLMAFSSAASASAFQLWEQSASGVGNAYAGSAAIADNASMAFYNPAGLTQLTGFQLSAGVAGVGPSYKFRDDGNSVGSGGSGGNGGNAGSWAAVPNAHFSWQLSPDWFVGFGISSPFGLATEYEDSSWIGRRQSLKSEVKTINYNPSLGYRVNDKVSLGFGVNYQTIDAELTTAVSSLNGDDAAWGWNAGALFTLSPAMRVGVSYRSPIKYTLTGTANGLSVKADVKLPDTFILSVWQQVSDRWEAMGDLSYTRWNTLKTLDVYRQDTGALLSGSETFNYRNAWRLAWGAAYLANDALKVKFGIAFDRTPTTNADRSARVPDNNRLWLSLGGQWKIGKASKVDLGYSYLYVRDPSINQSKLGTTLSGHYDASAHIVGVQYSTGF